ncbi:MAG: hypothetical protein ACI8P3_002510 [Saprospiraceae bacterium]|jgi:uncharacterized protein (DUF1501 family)
MKRRTFLQTASVVSIPVMLNGMNVSAIARSPFVTAMNGSDKVLVLIQLDGGNDGLNTLIPLDQYDKLFAVRENIIIPESNILQIENNLGLHPSMSGMKNMYDDGKLKIIQDVGYPNQNRSHFRSTDIWTSGSAAEEFDTTGWMGRYFEGLYPGYPNDYPDDDCPDPFAITLGSIVSQTCQATGANYSTALIDPDNLTNIIEGEPGDIDLNTCYGMQLDFLRQAIAQSNAYADSISVAANSGTNLITYPEDNRLAEQLKIVAQLISGGLQTSVYVVKLGGFDTHANQIEDNAISGNHADLLKTLSDAISVFQQDLELLGVNERVVGMTFSEFGRRIASNASFGTDHGTAAPLFVFGSCINPTVLGQNFEIPDEVGLQDGVPMQYDFRSVYGSILMDWFEVTESEVQSLLYEDFQYLPIIQSCVVATNTPTTVADIETYSFPNPFENWTTIVYQSKGEKARISIYDMRGCELKVITEQYFVAGEHQLKIDMSGLAAGNYSYRIVTKNAQRSKVMVKI